MGNLINRSDVLTGTSFNNDVGELKYDQLRNAGVHAVTSAAGVNYSYDKYGNMTARGSESILYDTFNKPTRITGASITDFYYGPDHELYKETSGTKTTYKLAGGLYEVIVDGTTTTQKSYVDGVILNSRVLTNGTQSANDTVYLHTDHLGSVEATTNALGQFVNRMSFGAWGERQKSDWKPGNPTENFLTSNGYTGHDQLDSHNLIHMGGRVYDPNLGRFLSADIVVQSPYDSQSYNRYSYTFNNPLSYVDPSGYKAKSPGAKDLDDALEEVLVTGQYTNQDLMRQVNHSNYVSWHASASSGVQWAYHNGVSYNISDIQGMTQFALAAGGYFPGALKKEIMTPQPIGILDYIARGDGLLQGEVLDAARVKVSSAFNAVRHGKVHVGVDLTAHDEKGNKISGVNVLSGTSGVVEQVWRNHKTLGNAVSVKTGKLYFTYAHLSKINIQAIKAGTVVKVGDVLGVTGCTGSCSGEHLHLQIKDTLSLGGNSYGPGTEYNQKGWLQ